jgi:hypothetical protein
MPMRKNIKELKKRRKTWKEGIMGKIKGKLKVTW